jgi:hypothetical protein
MRGCRGGCGGEQETAAVLRRLLRAGNRDLGRALSRSRSSRPTGLQRAACEETGSRISRGQKNGRDGRGVVKRSDRLGKWRRGRTCDRALAAA